MNMLKTAKPLLITSFVCSVLLITACTPKSEHSTTNDKPSKDASQDVIDQLKTQRIKKFPSTPDDAHDIALLTEYDQKFNQMSEEIEADLRKMAKDGNLTEEITHQRKRDQINSSLNMLKDLDLKTEQGRYIQGLLYQYWENQIKVYDEKKASPDGELKTPSDAVKGMRDMFTANDQLEYWKTVTPKS
ncbi:hypothetical protein [Acinetobacter sp. ANC 3832]|uniref:hypothetical protein n=1 Tax=Acinetobacter sp. ANC 3832 TaxID=1977874 RepID=UPI000A331449|nr:hypothetical protein [Acinetobacter sp. ANC 3832]OTG96290.1 hypothetical protein B9T35_01075 [Acinetobacter sp. ANC 3832]